MKVFLSWSGATSKAVAIALKAWMTDIFPDVEPWMSAEDIAAGQKWNDELDTELEACNYGVLCLTRENLQSKWLMFEAGKLSKSKSLARVAPYLFALSPADVAPPLSQFQGVTATESGTLQLAQSINSLRASPYLDEKLARAYSRWWPDLNAALSNISNADANMGGALRTDREVLEELLATVREIRFEAATNRDSKPMSDVRRVFALVDRIERMSPSELEAAVERAERSAGEEHAGAAGAQLFLDVLTHWLTLGKSSHPNR